MDPERKLLRLNPRPNVPDNDTVSPYLIGSIADIDSNITFLQNSLSLYPRSHSEHINCIYNIVEERFARYRLSQDKVDLDKSILYCTEAIFLPPVDRHEHPLNNFVQLLCFLAFRLQEHSELDQPEAVEHSIEYLRYLRGLNLDSFDLPRNEVTSLLIRVLATRVTLDAGDRTRDMKEMVVLCRELLTIGRLASNTSADFPIEAFRSLNKAIVAEFKRGRLIQPLEEVSDCLRDAVKVFPSLAGLYDALFVLARQLLNRFAETRLNHDYEGAMALFEPILDPSRLGECPDLIRDQSSSLVTDLAFWRSTKPENPEYSHVAISRIRTELSSPSISEVRRLELTGHLVILCRRRFTQYSLPDSLEEANTYISQVIGLSSSQSLDQYLELLSRSGVLLETCSTTDLQQKIQHLEELLSITPPGQNVTEMASEPLQIGIIQSSSAIAIYRISKSLSSIADCHSMRLIPVTHGDIITLLPCATSSSSRSRKPRRSATSTSQSPSAMTFSS